MDSFLNWFDSGDQLALVARNRQRTSTRGGILKAEAAIRYAEVLRQAGVVTLGDAQLLLADADRLQSVEDELKSVPGEGHSAVRRGYLWMLVGADNLIKPDRMVLRWLERQGHSVNAQEARTLLATIAPAVSAKVDRPVTPWEIDHAIWQDARR
ncbi:MAG: hypothetical protein LLG14_19515 [Nocardiaceae bacterium]|nr:hypothetical protein [Nocardiaceae bacterium]